MIRGRTIGVLCPACPAASPLPRPAAIGPAAIGPAAIGPAAPRRRAPIAAAVFVVFASVLLIAPSRAIQPSLVLSVEADDHGPAPAARFQVAAAEAAPVHALTIGFDRELAERVELNWYHPLAGARELPRRADRRFGAYRPGDRVGCGGGHCGVDLGDTAGAVVHAALPGTVTRAVRAADGRAGKYVRLEHPGGVATYYMHLDRLHPDLVPGMEVAAGDAIGLIGSTGVHSSPPHLHFAVSLKTPHGTRYVDPEPMLREAVLLDEDAVFPAAEPPGEEVAGGE